MARDPYDHGQEEIDCPTCHGLGQVVQPEVYHNPNTGRVETIERANVCRGCGGQKKVWV